MSSTSKWGRVNCFFCGKLMPIYAPGTMISRARTEEEVDLYLCSRCFRKVRIVLRDDKLLSSSLQHSTPPASTRRIVDI